MKINEIVYVISRLLFLIVAVALIYMVILKLLGHSPFIETVIVSSFGGMFIFFIKAASYLSKMHRDIFHLQRQFTSFAHDFKDLRKEFYDFKGLRKEFYDFKEEMRDFKKETEQNFREIKQMLTSLSPRKSF